MVSIIKKLVFILYMFGMILCLDQSFLSSGPFSKSIILPDRFLTSDNIDFSNNVYKPKRRDNLEKMIYTPVHLKTQTEYIVTFDVDIEVSLNEPTQIHVDLWAPDHGFDLPEQEVVFKIDSRTMHRNMFAKIDSLDIPEPALLRIFYYTPNRASVGNIRIREMTTIGAFTRLSVFLLVPLISIHYMVILIRRKLLPFIRDKASFHCKLNSLLPSVETVNIALSLFTVYWIFVFIRFSISLTLQNPLIPTDELAYKNMAYSYFTTGSFYNTTELGLAAHVPNILYQWIISVVFFFGNNFLIAAKLVNAIIMNAVVFPVFFLLREFTSNRRAMLGSLLVLMLSSMNFGYFVMVEALFFPLYMTTFLLLYKNLCEPKRDYSVVSGILLALLVLTKINGIALIISFVATSIPLCFFPLTGGRRHLGQTLETLMFTIIAFLLSYMVLGLIFKGSISFSIGYYDQLVSQEINQEIFSSEFVRMALAHVVTFLFFYFLPFIVIIKGLFHTIRFKLPNESILIILILTNTVFFMGMVFKFSADIAHLEHLQRLHARYYFVIYPLFISAFLIFSEMVRYTVRQKISLIFLYILVVVSSFLYFLPNYATSPLIIIDHPELSWFIFARTIDPIIYGIILCSLVSAAIYMFSKRNKAASYIVFLVAMFTIANYGQIIMSQQSDANNSRRTLKYLPIIRSHIPDFSATVVIVEPGNDNRFYIPFWCPYHYAGNYIIADGASITDRFISDQVEFLILFGDYKLDIDQRRKTIYRDNDLSIISLI